MNEFSNSEVFFKVEKKASREKEAKKRKWREEDHNEKEKEGMTDLKNWANH